MKRPRRWLLGLTGVGLLVFGLFCLNYTKADGLEHHRAVAHQHGLPEPGPPILYGGVAAIILGAGVVGYMLGRRCGTAPELDRGTLSLPEKKESKWPRPENIAIRESPTHLARIRTTSPSDPPLVFQGRLTLADVLCIRRYEEQLVVSRPLLMFARIFFTSVVALGLVGMLLQKPEARKAPEWVGVVAFVIFAYFLFLFSLQQRWMIRHQYRKNEAAYLETRVRLTEDRVAFENEAHRTDFQWQRVGLVVDAPEGLMFRNQARQTLFWLPQRLFEGNDLREQVLSLAARNGAPIRELE
jgi:hypothetical protein